MSTEGLPPTFPGSPPGPPPRTFRQLLLAAAFLAGLLNGLAAAYDLGTRDTT